MSDVRDESRRRPRVSITLDRGVLAWFDDLRGDLPRSHAFEAILLAFRRYIEGIAEATADPRLDLMRRARELLQAARDGKPADPENVAALVEALLKVET